MSLKNNSYLAGRLLLAMPQINDPRFAKAVIFIGAHDDKGAMGIVMNNPLPVMTFKSLLDQLNIKAVELMDPAIAGQSVLAGGPVETSRGFMIHGKDFVTNDTVQAGAFAISGTLAALKAAAQGQGPKDLRFALGYAGWSAGQLEQEIQENAWMVAPATHEIVFRTAPELMWGAAFAALGVNPNLISNTVGRA
jgi:putative transcriptional regulator